MSQATMFLGLIFDIVILLFMMLSILLIYSLLMISVESRAFEFGVIRMNGLSSKGIVYIILTQATMFVMPAVITGFIFAINSLSRLNKIIFEESLGIVTSPAPSAYAVGQALIMGILIPVFSSIAPIQKALSKDLNESLDIQRSKAKVVDIEILDPKNNDMSSYIVFGLLATLYGMSIYYLLPLSLLSFNFSLVLKIFILILVGMLLGLTMLAFNLQRFVEIVFTYVLLFFERKSMKRLVSFNLASHRQRNKMTSLVYSMSLGFIIFLIVSYRTQLLTMRLQKVQYEGCLLILKTRNQYVLKPEQFDKLLKKHSDLIESYAYVTT